MRIPEVHNLKQLNPVSIEQQIKKFALNFTLPLPKTPKVFLGWVRIRLQKTFVHRPIKSSAKVRVSRIGNKLYLIKAKFV